MRDYFYGWYFRCQGKEGSIAVIPAVHLSAEKRSCSIQVITQQESLYREFPISRFRIDRKREVMQIGENLFSGKGIRLSFETETAGQVSGILRFGEFAEPGYDIMGPFAFLPGMECRHAVYSMKHTVNGVLRVGQQKLSFQNADGYMEGDSGTSFPDRYIWTQHFFPGGSLMLAAATIPLGGMRFTGTVGFILSGSREYRFGTYLGASVRKTGDRELLVRQGRSRLSVRFLESGGNVLKAPDGGKMTRRVRENIACGAEYTWTYGKQVLMHIVTDRAAAECDAKFSKITATNS